jgi:hypothetical protein
MFQLSAKTSWDFFTVVWEVFDVQSVKMEDGGKSCTLGEVEPDIPKFYDKTLKLNGSNLVVMLRTHGEKRRDGAKKFWQIQTFYSPLMLQLSIWVITVEIS